MVDQSDKSGHYYLRSKGLPEKGGYIWPDGIPDWYTEDLLTVFTYWEEDGTEFRIAYTRQQIEDQGMIFAPYSPMSVGRVMDIPPRPFTAEE